MTIFLKGNFKFRLRYAKLKKITFTDIVFGDHCFGGHEGHTDDEKAFLFYCFNIALIERLTMQIENNKLFIKIIFQITYTINISQNNIY